MWTNLKIGWNCIVCGHVPSAEAGWCRPQPKQNGSVTDSRAASSLLRRETGSHMNFVIDQYFTQFELMTGEYWNHFVWRSPVAAHLLYIYISAGINEWLPAKWCQLFFAAAPLRHPKIVIRSDAIKLLKSASCYSFCFFWLMQGLVSMHKWLNFQSRRFPVCQLVSWLACLISLEC